MTKEEFLKIDLKANLKAYIKCRFPEKEEDFIENMANYIIEQIGQLRTRLASALVTNHC